MNHIREELQDKFIENKISIMRSDVVSKEKQMVEIQADIEIMREARQFLLSFTENLRDKMKERIESIVNTALKAIFVDEAVEFKIIPRQTKNGVLYDLFGVTNGVITPLVDCNAGGLLDVVSMALRISFLRLFSSKLRQSMILDEPFKNLDKVRIVLACQWLKMISKEFDMQFIIVTHIEDLIDNADKVFRFVKIAGETTIK
jgi:DNA repair exonuclease SbcCD ATPase subunit